MFLHVYCMDCKISYDLNIGTVQKETAEQAANRVKCSVCQTPAFASANDSPLNGGNSRDVKPLDGTNITSLLNGIKSDLVGDIVKLTWQNVYQYFVPAPGTQMQSKGQPWRCKGCDFIVSSVYVEGRIGNLKDKSGKSFPLPHSRDSVGLPVLHRCHDGTHYSP